MINVLLVDDDALFRASLAGMQNWGSLGCRIAFQADNGRQAIDIINRESVGLLITDMDMPLINGVELIRYLRQSSQKIPCLALSGYDDFDYVRESMRLGAGDYLLKHVLTKKSLEEAVLSVIGGERNGDAMSVTLESVRNAMACDLMLGRVSPPTEQSLEETLKQLGIHIPQIPYSVILVRMREQFAVRNRYSSEDTYIKMLQNAKQILTSIAERQGEAVCLLDRDDSFYLILSNREFSSTIFALNSLHVYADQISKAFRRFLEIDVEIQAGDLCHKANRIMASAKSAVERLENLEPDDLLLEWEDNGFEHPLDPECERQVLLLLSQQNRVLLEERIEAIFQQCKSNCGSRQSMVRLSVELLALLQRECRRCNVAWIGVCSNGGMSVEQLAQIRSYRQLTAYVRGAYVTAHRILSREEKTHSPLIELALRQIRCGYAEPMTLASTAEIIRCNSAYLSRSFKQEIGSGFTQYLTEYRIEQAIDALRCGESVKEAAKNTGFQSYNYFFRVFKKHTGMTPQEFLEKREPT